MSIIPKNLHTKYGLNTTEDKGVTSNMYLTETHRLKTHWIHKIGNSQPLTWTTFPVEINQFLQLRILGRILSGSWVGSYQDLG